MNVTIDEDSCCGHAICCSMCPDVFTLTDDGYSVVSAPEVPGALEETVQTAAQRCPEHAIIIS